MRLLRASKTGSAAEQLDIKFVQDGVLTLSSYRFRLVLETSSVNFELKSEDEQDALIETYQSFLNSVGYRFQILVRIRELDLDGYLNNLSQRSRNESAKIWRAQLSSYGDFVKSLVSSNKILSRSFYLIVPLDASAKTDFDIAKEQLALRAEIVTKGLQRLGMHVRQLSSLEVLNLFYSFYNPRLAKTQPLGEIAINKIHNALAVTRK